MNDYNNLNIFRINQHYDSIYTVQGVRKYIQQKNKNDANIQYEPIQLIQH
ncbi:hypothetical protein pb186bvf_014439 [Paramecium bursaria]